MSEEQPTEATETEPKQATSTGEQQSDAATLPDDHPLVKTLAEQKKTIRDLKARAAKLDEIEEAQKSEAERAADRIAELEKQASDAQREALRFKVASKYGVTDEDADLFLTGSDEETLRRQAERLAGRTDERQRQGNTVPNEGSRPADAKATAGDQFADWAAAQFTH